MLPEVFFHYITCSKKAEIFFRAVLTWMKAEPLWQLWLRKTLRFMETQNDVDHGKIASQEIFLLNSVYWLKFFEHLTVVFADLKKMFMF